MKLEPAWAAELLADWGRADIKASHLALPSVCPSFRKLLGYSSTSAKDDDSEITAEQRAVILALDKMRQEHREHHAIICRYFRPQAGQQPLDTAQQQILAEAVFLVAQTVDETLG